MLNNLYNKNYFYTKLFLFQSKEESNAFDNSLSSLSDESVS